MWLFFTITLLLSCLGMLVLLWLKRYELRTGRMFFAGARPRLGEFFSRTLVWVEYALPALLAHAAKRLWRAARVLAHRTVAWVVVGTETLLERGLQVLRHKTDAPRQGGEASPFLREVAEHKKILRGGQDDGQPE